ncbi:hypothetical protein [Fredinandcohnia quinoae]|uniref:Lipoprotein n=1 Tax=Fredinandcohnia quinoae TaxID=2918902 RepID=A0AAW5E4Y0_9BACI|nr:hypothetical protein [Fredinandcohnia sp. SECRCQ15]MCH1624416.1 hypothetical protein [Fredinandcohnia sp. SECRCQ15]
MKSRYSIWKSISALVIVFMLSACTGETKPSSTTKKETPETESVSPSSSEQNPTAKETRPAVESFELLTSEGNQKLEATLHQGEGFSLYVFDKFTFDATTGHLSLSGNPGYYVDIEPLPSDYDLTKLEVAGMEELSQIGDVSNFSGELVEHPLGFADLYLQASGKEGISDYIVWTSESGDAFLFRLHNPKGAEASDFAGPILISLSTVLRE